VDRFVEPVHAGLLAAGRHGLGLSQALDVIVDLTWEGQVGREDGDRQQGGDGAEHDPADRATGPVGAGLPCLDYRGDPDDARRDPDRGAEDQQVNAAVQVAAESQQGDEADYTKHQRGDRALPEFAVRRPRRPRPGRPGWRALPWSARAPGLPESARLAELRLLRSGWLPELGRLAELGWLAKCLQARGTGLPIRGRRGVRLFLLVGPGGKEQPRQPG